MLQSRLAITLKDELLFVFDFLIGMIQISSLHEEVPLPRVQEKGVVLFPYDHLELIFHTTTAIHGFPPLMRPTLPARVLLHAHPG